MRVALQGMMELLEVVAVEEETLRAALASALTDFEDAVQHECALVCGAEAIITRDVKGFLGSRLPVFTPTDFIHRHVVTT